jgi:hypothetical protein
MADKKKEPVQIFSLAIPHDEPPMKTLSPLLRHQSPEGDGAAHDDWTKPVTGKYVVIAIRRMRERAEVKAPAEPLNALSLA